MKRAVLFLSLLFLVFICSGSHSQQIPTYKSLCAQLKDLPGWKADKCEGMNMSGSAMGNMVTANRTYTKGKQELQSGIIWGMQAGMHWAPFSQKIQMETDENLIKIISVNGFDVGITFSKKENNGSIMVRLNKGEGVAKAIFFLHFENMKWQDALDIAKKFDWKGMEKLVK